MKKTMRIGTLSCIMMLTASMMLSACGTSTGSTGGQTTPAAEGDGNKQLATIKFVYPGSPQADEAKIEEAINQKLASTLNAKLDIMPIDWGQWENKINLMIASREPVDVIFTAQWNGHAINVSKGAFLALNDDSLPKYGNLLKQYGKGITDSLDPIFLEGAKINGKNYGVPTNKELAAQGGVIYREDIAKELNLDMSKVKKIEDLEAVLSVVKEKKPELTPLFLRDGDNLNSHYFSQYDYLGDSTIPGVILKDETSTKVVPKYELPRYKEIVNVTRSLMKKGLVNKDAATTPLSGQDAMKAGNIFMITASLKPGKDAEMASVIGLQGKLKQIDMTERTISTGETAGSMLGISSASSDPVKAMQFINLLHTDKELNNLLNFGIEGTHYVKTSGDIIKAGPQYKGYSPGAAWQFGSQFLNYIWDNEDPKKWDQFRAFNKDAKKSPGLGFTFNAEPVKTEVAAAANIVKEFDPGLDTGSVEPDTVLPKYMEKLKASGQDKIIAEKQKQFDSYLSTKK